MDNYSIKFLNVLNEVKYKILFELSLYSENSERKEQVDKLHCRLDFLEETTIRYILSNANACLCGSSAGTSFMEKNDIEPRKYDKVFDINIFVDYLKKILSEFECNFSLPSIDDIDNEVSIFGFNSKSDPKKFASLYYTLKKCDSPLFYEMYDFASSKGLSNSEIFSTFCRIFKMLSYYNYDIFNHNILSYVPYLNCEIEEFFREKEHNFSVMSK